MPNVDYPIIHQAPISAINFNKMQHVLRHHLLWFDGLPKSFLLFSVFHVNLNIKFYMLLVCQHIQQNLKNNYLRERLGVGMFLLRVMLNPALLDNLGHFKSITPPQSLSQTVKLQGSANFHGHGCRKTTGVNDTISPILGHRLWLQETSTSSRHTAKRPIEWCQDTGASADRMLPTPLIKQCNLRNPSCSKISTTNMRAHLRQFELHPGDLSKNTNLVWWPWCNSLKNAFHFGIFGVHCG